MMLIHKIGFYRYCLSRISLFFFLLIISTPVFTACVSSSSAYDPEKEYANAVADASSVTADKISRNLTAIVPENANLIWEDGVVGSRVLVVSWVDQNACNIYKCPPGGCQPGDTCKEGRECQYGRDTYVTVVPELKNFFQGTMPDPLRIAQLLGLPPSDARNKVCFLEIWVSPDDLFRPAADPEITDHEAQLNFPGSPFWQYDASRKVFADQACDPALCTACTQWGECGFTGYKNYFNNRKKYLYTSAHPYPWTALGYTYDWGNPANHIGLSEFVINGRKEDGSKIAVKIKAVTETAAYFSGN
jgi:hypothetical protein